MADGIGSNMHRHTRCVEDVLNRNRLIKSGLPNTPAYILVSTRIYCLCPGPLPTEVGQLTGLTEMDLSWNRLNGL